MTDEHNTDMRIIRVPMIDTGLGIEAGYANDKELVNAADAQREEMKALLTPEAWARLEEAEKDLQRRVIEGRGRVESPNPK